MAVVLPTSRSAESDWAGLFRSAFRKSRNAMALVDHGRVLVDVNGALLQLVGHSRDDVVGRPVAAFVAGGPRYSPAEWQAALASGRFAGDVELVHADGSLVAMQWDASSEVVTGRHLVLVVAMSTSRWGSQFRRTVSPDDPPKALTAREREIADELHIAHDTVRTHVRNAMTRLGARSRAHLVAKALAGGDILF